MPRRIMGRDSSVAAATREMPPRPKDRASQAAPHRRAFSWSNGARASYFRRTLEIIDPFAIMTVYDNYAFWNSYFGPTPWIVEAAAVSIKACVARVVSWLNSDTSPGFHGGLRVAEL